MRFITRLLFRRFLIFPVLLVGALGIPYLLGSPSPLAKLKSLLPGQSVTNVSNEDSLVDADGFTDRQEEPTADFGITETEVAPTYKPEDVFRLDISINDILSRWPNVSTGLAELDLFGYRVPLVTGVEVNDIAGSLTYYFDGANICQRIAFEGTTGNSDKLIHVLSKRFELRRVRAKGPSVFVYQANWNGQSVSELRIRPVPIIRHTQPHRRFEVSFYLSRFQDTWIQNKLTSSR